MRIISIAISVIVCFMFVNSCKQKASEFTFTPTGNDLKDGAILSKHYCGGCHKYPSPDILDKATWTNHALPSMAPKLQISVWGEAYFQKDLTTELSLENWNKIVSYYQTLAPDSLTTKRAHLKLNEDWAIFKFKQPKRDTTVKFTTMVSIDPSSSLIYTSDLMTNKLYEWDKNLDSKVIADLESPAVSFFYTKIPNGSSRALVSCIGTIENSDDSIGSIEEIVLNNATQKTTIASALPKPVYTISADFNKDKINDYLVCGLGGKTKGGLYLVKNNQDNKTEIINLKPGPGPTQLASGDFNQDGWTDFMALFSVGDERLTMYLNDQNGRFTSQTILRFNPANGSTSFQIIDFNKDGKLDIIYTNGFNFADSRILKPYHGLSIFINQGDFKFKRKYFYPINGCSKAVVSDFDNDGDYDIATIAFFADFVNKPSESFIYFEQNNPLSFKPHAIPVYKKGRWMCMDAGDIDKDGDMDIVLGNYSKGFINQKELKPFWDKQGSILVLENNSKHK